MLYPTLAQILVLHERIIATSGGSNGVRDRGLLKSALSQPQMTFAGAELYPTLPDKAAAVGFSLIKNHPFVDGNKRIGHAAMELLLLLNGFEVSADVDEQERVILQVAAGQLSRDAFTTWVSTHVVSR